jgi:hypothetical protein
MIIVPTTGEFPDKSFLLFAISQVPVSGLEFWEKKNNE